MTGRFKILIHNLVISSRKYRASYIKSPVEYHENSESVDFTQFFQWAYCISLYQCEYVDELLYLICNFQCSR